MPKFKRNTESVTMPAGEYFVGDPCYSVPDERWMEWLEAADYTNERRFLTAELDGHPVLGIGTAHGDGTFYDQEGREYGVDAGLIGLVPVALNLDADPGALAHRVTFDSEFTCRYDEGDEGTIVLGHIEIPTDPSDGYFQ